MDTDDEIALPRELRYAIIMLWVLVLFGAVITIIDWLLKQQITTQIDRYAALGRDHAGQPGPGQQQPSRPTVRRHDGGLSRMDPVAPAPAPGPAENGVHEAPAIVRPGDESARPPRRGSFHTEGTGDGG